jgi:hypothetical protein
MFGYTMKNQIYESGDFLFIFPSLLVTKNLQNHFFFKILILKFAFWRNFATKIKKQHYFLLFKLGFLIS